MLLIGPGCRGLTARSAASSSSASPSAPTSPLITETAPAQSRGRFAGLAQVLWYVGAIAPLILGNRPRHARDADHLRPAPRGRADHLGAAAGDDLALAVGEGARRRSQGGAVGQLLKRRHVGALAS